MRMFLFSHLNFQEKERKAMCQNKQQDNLPGINLEKTSILRGELTHMPFPQTSRFLT